MEVTQGLNKSVADLGPTEKGDRVYSVVLIVGQALLVVQTTVQQQCLPLLRIEVAFAAQRERAQHNQCCSMLGTALHCSL